MAAAGVDDFDDSRTVVFGTSSDAVQAAIDGNAVALADFAMVANDLSQGRLIRPFELGIRVSAEFAYFLVYPGAWRTIPGSSHFALASRRGRKNAELSGASALVVRGPACSIVSFVADAAGRAPHHEGY